MNLLPATIKTVPALFFLYIVFFPLKDTIYDGSALVLDLLFLVELFRTSAYAFLRKHRLLLCSFLAILVSMTLSNAFGIGGREGWIYQGIYCTHFFLFLVALIFFLDTGALRFRSVLLFLVISLAVHSFNGAVQYFSGADLIRHQPLFEQRITGAVRGPNHFGLILMAGVQVIFFVFLAAKRLLLPRTSVWGLAALLALTLFCLLYSGSRAAWVGLLAGVVTFLALEWRNIPGKTPLFTALILAGTLTLFSLDPLFQDRVAPVSPEHSSSSIRLTTWRFILEKVVERPFLGHGVDSLPALAQGMPPEIVHSPHNVFLEIALYLGGLGSAAFFFFFYAVGKRLAETRLDREIFVPLVTLLSSLTVNSLFGNSLITDRILLAILALLLAVLFSDTRRAAAGGQYS